MKIIKENNVFKKLDELIDANPNVTAITLDENETIEFSLEMAFPKITDALFKSKNLLYIKDNNFYYRNVLLVGTRN